MIEVYCMVKLITEIDFDIMPNEEVRVSSLDNNLYIVLSKTLTNAIYLPKLQDYTSTPYILLYSIGCKYTPNSSVKSIFLETERSILYG